MTYTDLFHKAAEMVGVNVVYCTMEGANVVLDTVRQYPVVVRPFEEPCTLLEDGLPMWERSALLYFMTPAPVLEFETLEAVMPTIEDMRRVAVEFARALRSLGVEVTLGEFANTMSRFDALEAGVTVRMTTRYKDCYQCCG